MRVATIKRGKTQNDGGTLWSVGAQDVDRDYVGPIAEISADDTWLYIETDPYEGSVMLNIEALPVLLRALIELHAEHFPSKWRMDS